MKGWKLLYPHGFFFKFYIAPLLVLTIATTAISIMQSEKARQAQEEAREKQQTMAEIKAEREKTQAIREARIKRARIANIAGQTGVELSSGAQGAQAVIGSQLGSRLGFQETQTGFARAISQDLSEASSLQGSAATLQGISSIAAGASQFGDSGEEPE